MSNDVLPKSHKYSNFFLGSKQSVYNGWLNAMVFKDKSLLDDLIAYAEKFKIQFNKKTIANNILEVYKKYKN